MPFIYKPFRQSMSPMNETINPSVGNTFSVNVNGQVCNGYRFRVFDMNNNLVSAPSTSLVKLGSPLYDGDTLNISVASGTLTAGDRYKWQIDLYSTFLTVSSVNTTTNLLTVTNHNFLNGDVVYLQTTGTFPQGRAWADNWTDGTAYYVDDRVFYTANSKYYKCIANHTASASILPTDATKWVEETYTTWATGTAYPIGKVVYYSTDGKYYRCKTAHTSSSTIIPTDTKYWIVDDTWGICPFTKYYVRGYDKNNLLLFTTIEGAKNNQGAIDLTSAGTGTITISNIASSDEMPFSSYSLPTVTLTLGTINTQSYTFSPVYSHSQGVLVNKFQALLYNDDGDLIDDSGEIYSSNVKYYFNGFLTNTYYKVRFIITNNVGQVVDTGMKRFFVSYNASNILINASAENICEDSCIKISWSNIFQTAGTVTGTSRYVENFLVYNNNGLDLDPSSNVTYNDVIMNRDASLPMFIWKPETTAYVGIIAEFSNSTTGENVKIYYDGTRFYQDRSGVILNNVPLSLTANGAYLIAIVGTDLITNLIYPE